jgi:hypothetical protein
MKKYIGFLLICLCLTNSISAQENRFTGWVMSMNTIQLHSRFLFQFDAQLRSTDRWEKSETLIFRPVFSYLLNKETAVGLGYAAISSWRTIEGVRDRLDEKRLWQQVNVNKRSGSLAIQHRFRMEERWLPEITVQNGGFTKTGYAFSSRFRYFTRFMAPINKTSSFSRGVYWAAQNELFFNLLGAEVVNNKLFDQSRTYAGGGFRINKAVDAELGYMLVHNEGRGKNQIRNNIIQLSSFLRL